MEFDIQKNENGLTYLAKPIIDKRKSYMKIILGENEEDILKEFISSINVITTRGRAYPHIFTFNSRDYMAFILSRVVKYYSDEIRLDGSPLNKWRIEDLRYKFGNFNDEYILFDYFGLSPIENRYFYTEEVYKDKKEMAAFFNNASNKIYNLSVIASRIIDNTYSDNWGPKVVVSLEIEPQRDRLEEFKETFPYLKDEPEETLLRYMRNNFAFSRLMGISICRLTDTKIEEETEEGV